MIDTYKIRKNKNPTSIQFKSLKKQMKTTVWKITFKNKSFKKISPKLMCLEFFPWEDNVLGNTSRGATPSLH